MQFLVKVRKQVYAHRQKFHFLISFSTVYITMYRSRAEPGKICEILLYTYSVVSYVQKIGQNDHFQSTQKAENLRKVASMPEASTLKISAQSNARKVVKPSSRLKNLFFKNFFKIFFSKFFQIFFHIGLEKFFLKLKNIAFDGKIFKKIF